ncbi:MAG: hypothetical protein K2Q19_12310 [Rhodocyclaceae bacterium]|nr:hypothetical protein [Rhodocyclaceae bacterium]
MKFNAIATASAVILALSAAPAFAKNEKVGKDHSATPDMSDQGMHNTNSAYSTDRDKGRERSAERMSESGAAHSHSGDPQRDKEYKVKKIKKDKAD